MNTDTLHLPIHFVLFHFGDVVTHIVDEWQVLRTCFAPKDARERLTHSMHEQLTIRPCKVCPASHCTQVCFPQVGLQRQTCQLAVYQTDAKILLLGVSYFDK